MPPSIVAPPKTYDFSQDAFTPAANKSGKTPVEMSAMTEQAMRDRVLAQSAANPGTLFKGGQTGALPTGTESTPVLFQAFTNKAAAPTPSIRPPTGTAYNPADGTIRDPLTNSVMTQSEGGYRFISPETIRSSREAAIKGLMDQGIKDQGQILNYLNFSEDGQKIGDFTPEEVSKYTGGTPGFQSQDVAGYTDANGLYHPPTTTVDPNAAPAAPGTSTEIDKLRSQLKTPQQIDADLIQQLDTINAKYDVESRTIRSRYENAKQAEFSSLASLGVNPASSGASSVAAAGQKDLDDALAANDARKQLEIQAARAAAYGMKTDTIYKQIDLLRQQEADAYQRSQDEAKARQDEIKSNLDTMKFYAQQAREDKQLSQAEKGDAFEKVQKWFTLFGSSAFDGISDEDTLALERASDIPAGSISMAAKTLREREIEAKKTSANAEKQFIAPTRYSSGYVFDKATGVYTPVTTGRISAPPSGGGGGGTSSGVPKGFVAFAQTMLTNLSKGMEWGSAFNAVKATYPKVPNEVIDSYLDKPRWSKEGAYENSLATQKEFRGTPPKEKTVTRETEKYRFYSDGSFEEK